MADSIVRLKVDSQEYDNKLKRAAEGIQRYADGCRKVGGSLEDVEKDTLDFVKAIGQMDTVSRTATGKLAEMKKAFVELSAQYKQMTDAEKASPMGKALAASLDQLKGRIQDSKSQLDDINKSINGGGGLTGALDNMLGKVGLNVEGLMKFGGAAGAATTALKVAKDAFFASETSLDEWGRTVQSSQSLYQGFLSALNNSDISGFLSRMDEIVGAARDAYNAMDELGTFSAFQQRNVAKGRAGYAQALDEYRLNPTADNKQKLAQANQKVMNDLRESHDKTEAAYQAALRQIATERISGKGMQDAFVKMFSEGNYGDLQAAKASYSTGRLLNSGAQYYYGDRVYDGRVQDRATGKWRDMSNTEKQQFEFARALSQVNDSQIKEVQALGAQSVAITEQIYQQDRAYNRLSGNNAPLRGGGGSGGSGRGGKGGGKTTTVPTYAEGSIAWQEQEVSNLTKKWKEAGDAVRDDYAVQLSYAKQQLAEMTGGFDPEKVKDISGQSANLTQGAEITVPVKLEIKSPVEQWQAEIKRLQELIGQTWDSAAIDVYNQKIDQLNEKINDFSHTSVKGGESSSKAWSSTASAISSVGSAINAIDDPTAKIIGLVAQGIASVVSATGIATEKAAGQSRHWAEYLAAAASITAQMIATISQIHSASGYAQGGIVKGNSYSGDNIPADTFVNAGELILNKSQQGAIASQLQNGGGNLRVTGVLRGEDLLISIDKSARRQGRGELVFWKNQ